MIDSIQNKNFLLGMELAKYKENIKTVSGHVDNFILDNKKYIVK